MKSGIHKTRRGLALIAVIWVVGFLTMVLTVTLLFVKKESESIIASEHSFRAWQLAHSGLSFGVHDKIKRGDDILNFAPKDIDEGYSVSIASEDARINLNHVIRSSDKTFLRKLFSFWLDDSDAANELTDAMVDWVDTDDLISLNGAEKDWYKGRGFTNRPFNREFQTLSEVRLVKGFSAVEDKVPNWREWLTLHSIGAIDIHEAEPMVLSIAAETDISTAEQFVEIVRGEDQIAGTTDDVRYSNIDFALDALDSFTVNREAIINRFTLTGSTLRIESTGQSGDYRKKISAIMRRQGRTPRLLSYEETNLISE